MKLLIFLNLLTRSFIMFFSVNNEDPWHIESIEESRQQHPIQAEDATQEESSVPVRLSSRLASKSPSLPSINDWPLPKILETLFKRNVPVPTGATHEDLSILFCENADMSSTESLIPPPSSSKKNTQKRKNSEPTPTQAEANVTPKQAAGPAGLARTIHSMVQSNHPMLTALSSIQSLLSNMNSRIKTLESGSKTHNLADLRFHGPSTSQFTSARLLQPSDPEQDDDVMPTAVPRRTMGSAVPVSTGSPFFSPASVISHQLRSQILAVTAGMVIQNQFAQDEPAF
ncbi:hypothetical protein E1301_Tti023697 [Triplophysa tibetana]|uniref:Uncharacterized protein n=1 Tax=Triplophysa tibetana TaxID=1572043 RepID=A0A5A9NQX0_9TELE|nr:hypothetical protein E1301_Tti023697 [Triplophysa tibetana]